MATNNMNALTFTLKKNSANKIDCSRLTPDNLYGLSLKQIGNLSLLNSKNSPKVSDYFEVSGSNSENIIYKNPSSQLDFIGHKMSFGSIICQGDVGDRVGDQMRRGLILIDGNAGDYAASRMVAGTIAVFGGVGKYAGFGMKRGTILLNMQTNFHATIQDCGTHNLPFLALLFQSFKVFPSKFSTLKNQRVQRFAGDLACDGNGEILVLNA
jgi:formylmethanofuran dehydrogenase subunit C